MTKKNGTKRSLLMSALALVLCLSMLVGSTFAWFTDSVTSSGNIIKSGTLDVQMFQWTKDGENDPAATEITNSSAPLFGSNIIWEPNATHVVYLSLKNNGNLDLKYKVDLNVVNTAKNLYEVMEYVIVPDAEYGDVTNWASIATSAEVDVTEGVNAIAAAQDVSMTAGAEHFFALAIHMDEAAGNEYQGGAVEFDIKVEATQLNSEVDGFGTSDYDAGATYDAHDWPIRAIGSADFDSETEESATEITVADPNNFGTDGDGKVATFTIPKTAVADGTEKLEVTINETAINGELTIDDGLEAVTYDINVEGLKEENDAYVTVKFFIGKGLDPNTVKVYHKEDLIVSTYTPGTGYVTFQTKSFSPFTVVYDVESKYVPADPENGPLPHATVVRMIENEKVDLPWGNFGGFAPTENLDSQLEAAYKFVAPHNGETVKDCPYANWHCDFYVKLDKDLGENQIFLGGNYGDFGWVGFHNGEVTLAANEELPLLGSVTTNPWTYADVASFVGEFLCGVGDVDDALSGATFTVMLRLTNPENPNEYYNVNTVTYTFPTAN